MAIYTDHNVSLLLAQRLRARGQTVTTARDLGLERAPDTEHVLVASRHAWLLLTHNERDFKLLQDGWHRWSAAWNVSVEHAGIIVIPQWAPPRADTMVTTFLAGRPQLMNELYLWRSSVGWMRLARSVWSVLKPVHSPPMTSVTVRV